MLVRSPWLQRGRATAISPLRQQQLLCRAPRRHQSSPVAANQESISIHDGDVVCGTVTTKNASESTLKQLLEKVPRPLLRPDNLSCDASLRLLLTPAFAQHALDARVPLDLFTRLTSSSGDFALQSLHTSTAIVDRLASPNVSGSGSEGLSYIYARHPTAASVVNETAHKPSAQLPGSLSFVLPRVHPWLGNCVIQLPLAQTTFSTGLVSTLVGRRYRRFDDNGLNLEHEQLLNTQILRLPFRDASVNISTPLIPLTPFRIIQNHLGNIIRTLSSLTATAVLHGSAESPGSQTASEELETAVNRYFKAQNIPPQPVSVWALTIPDPGPQLTRLWNNELWSLSPEQLVHLWSSPAEERRFINADINRLLHSGARLCKVLSGGGGWGKKAGLLSLDPDTSYTGREVRVDEGWSFDFDDDSPNALQKQQREALGEVVSNGDPIMFLVAPHDEGACSLAQAQPWSHLREPGWSVVFGTIPSTIDELPESNKDAKGARVNSDNTTSVYTPNLFSGLSEGGLALSFAYEGRSQQVTQTKLDVPHARVTVSQSEQDQQRTVSTPNSEGYNEKSGSYDLHFSRNESFRTQSSQHGSRTSRTYSTAIVRAQTHGESNVYPYAQSRRFSHIARRRQNPGLPTQTIVEPSTAGEVHFTEAHQVLVTVSHNQSDDASQKSASVEQQPQSGGSKSYFPRQKHTDKGIRVRKVTRKSSLIRRVVLSVTTEARSTERKAKTESSPTRSIHAECHPQPDPFVPSARQVLTGVPQTTESPNFSGVAESRGQLGAKNSLYVIRKIPQDPLNIRHISSVDRTAESRQPGTGIFHAVRKQIGSNIPRTERQWAPDQTAETSSQLDAHESVPVIRRIWAWSRKGTKHLNVPRTLGIRYRPSADGSVSVERRILGKPRGTRLRPTPEKAAETRRRPMLLVRKHLGENQLTTSDRTAHEQQRHLVGRSLRKEQPAISDPTAEDHHEPRSVRYGRTVRIRFIHRTFAEVRRVRASLETAKMQRLKDALKRKSLRIAHSLHRERRMERARRSYVAASMKGSLWSVAQDEESNYTKAHTFNDLDAHVVAQEVKQTLNRIYA